MAKETSAGFHDDLHKLQKWVDEVSAKMDAASALSAPEQLAEILSLQENVAHQRPLVSTLESSCKELCGMLSDESAKQEIRSKLNATKKDMDMLTKRIGKQHHVSNKMLLLIH